MNDKDELALTLAKIKEVSLLSTDEIIVLELVDDVLMHAASPIAFHHLLKFRCLLACMTCCRSS
jgi:hypothetical protein